MMSSLKVLAKGPTFPAPTKAAAAHKPTLFGHLAMERWIFFGRSVPDRLKTLAQLRASSMVGCVWWQDIGTALGRELGIDQDTIDAVADWRATDKLNDVEKMVI